MLFLDVNIILEILLNRPKAFFCLEECKKHSQLFISPTCIHIIYYFAEKAGIDKKIVQDLLTDFTILNSGREQLNIAQKIYDGKEMEDALQIACATGNNISKVFTLDTKMIKKYSSLVSFVELK